MIKRPSKNVSVYLNYPTEERLKTLRERVAAWNFTDKMKEQRLSKIANEKEIVAYLMGDPETIAIVDSRQKEIDRRKNKQEIRMDVESPLVRKVKDKLFHDRCVASVKALVETDIEIKESKLPTFVQDVLNGGAYPEQYECDAREQKILYNQKFIELFQQYRTAKSQTTADIVLSQIVSLVKELDQ